MLKNYLPIICFITGISIFLQWVLVWTGVFTVNESVPGYTFYFYAFQIADMWIVLSTITAGFLLLKNSNKALIFGISAGSAMLFFGLNSILYDLITGLFFNFTSEEIIGKIITMLNITVGIFFIIRFWHERK